MGNAWTVTTPTAIHEHLIISNSRIKKLMVSRVQAGMERMGRFSGIYIIILGEKSCFLQDSIISY